MNLLVGGDPTLVSVLDCERAGQPGDQRGDLNL